MHKASIDAKSIRTKCLLACGPEPLIADAEVTPPSRPDLGLRTAAVRDRMVEVVPERTLTLTFSDNPTKEELCTP
jgi:hypothetical protein